VEQTRPILIVDDDAEIRQLLERYLRQNGYQARTAAGAEAMDRLMSRQSFCCLVLDLMMPGEDGLSVCRRLRGQGHDIPIIMLTARGEDVDRIVGLEMGADDYLPKPFNPRELLARIGAVLRRRHGGAPPGAPRDSGRVTIGDVVLDLAARALIRDGQSILLSTAEFATLEALVTRPGRPLSRDRIMDLSRSPDAELSDRSVDVQIHRLRRLIEPDPSAPRYIQTVRGFGYVFTAGAET
jgi:DNA-binding response OmpR family regulator